MKIRFFVIVVFITFFSSCVKEEITVPGPQGPMGPQGPEGNANAKVEFLEINPDQWEVDAVNNRIFSVWNSQIINEDIAEYGAVMVYYNSGDEWQILPYVWPGGNAIETFWYSPGTIEIERLGDTIIPEIPDVTEVYKVVAIATTD